MPLGTRHVERYHLWYMHGRLFPVRVLVGAAVTGAVLGGTALPARATFVPCGPPAGLKCETVTVPVSRADSTMGSIRLHVAREPATGKPALGAIVALAGGPGQSATARLASFAQTLRAARKTRDLIVLDQRGTGQSGYLSCVLPLDAGCGLGEDIHYYTTRDSADDIEAVRTTLGVERIALYGVSYGTKVALAYAKRYPSHVELLVLDSVVALDGFDFFERGSYAAVPRVLGNLCAGGSCSAFTASLEDDVAAAVTAAEARRLVVRTVDASGAPMTPTRPTSHDLFQLLVVGTSRDPVVRALFPAAVRSALIGDGFPLGRLLEASTPPGRDERGNPGFSEAVYRATLCEELAPTRWRNVEIAVRMNWATEFLDSMPLATFLPFTSTTAIDGDLVGACRTWPILRAPPTITGAGPPDVPTLLLDGEEDLLTPAEDAVAVRSAFRRGVLLRVPDMGHAVAASADRSSGGPCARRALDRFLAGKTVAGCAPTKPLLAPRDVAPTSLDALQPAIQPAPSGRLLRAAFATLADVRDVSRTLLLPSRGLRGGTFAKKRNGLVLNEVVYVPGVRVSGTYRPGGASGDLRVDGSPGSGRFRIGRDRKARGTIAGIPFVVRVPNGL